MLTIDYTSTSRYKVVDVSAEDVGARLKKLDHWRQECNHVHDHEAPVSDPPPAPLRAPAAGLHDDPPGVRSSDRALSRSSSLRRPRRQRRSDRTPPSL